MVFTILKRVFLYLRMFANANAQMVRMLHTMVVHIEIIWHCPFLSIRVFNDVNFIIYEKIKISACVFAKLPLSA